MLNRKQTASKTAQWPLPDATYYLNFTKAMAEQLCEAEAPSKSQLEIVGINGAVRHRFRVPASMAATIDPRNPLAGDLALARFFAADVHRRIGSDMFRMLGLGGYQDYLNWWDAAGLEAFKAEVTEAFGEEYEVLLEACSRDFGLHDALLRARSIEGADLAPRSQQDVIVKSSVAALRAAVGNPIAADTARGDKVFFGHGDDHRALTAPSGQRVYYVNLDALPEQSKDERMRSALAILAELGSTDASLGMDKTTDREAERGV